MVGSGHSGAGDVEVPKVSKISNARKPSVLQKVLEYSTLTCATLILPSRGHLATLGDNFGCYDLKTANGTQWLEPKDHDLS